MINDRINRQTLMNGQTAINTGIGLAQYEGNDKIYTDILENFAKNNKSTMGKLHDAIRENDMKLAYRTAHSLRGAAGAIGAERLARAAFNVENTLSPAGNVEPVFTGEKILCEQIALLEREFTAVFDALKTSVGEKEEARHTPGVPDRKKTVELMDKLAPFLEIGDTKCLEYLDEIEEIFLPAAETFKLFVTQMEQYDFEQAYETLNSIRRFMMC